MSTKPKGRPKGSKTQRYQTVRVVPAKCRACGCTDLRAIPGRKADVRVYEGTFQGAKYNRIRWQLKKCHECGHRQYVQSHEFVRASRHQG